MIGVQTYIQIAVFESTLYHWLAPLYRINVSCLIVSNFLWPREL